MAKIIFRRGSLTATLAKASKEQRLAARGEDGKLRWVNMMIDRVTFEGGKWGAHSLDATDMERVRNHWEGYCESNGETGRDIRIGGPIAFQRGMFDRRGHVLAIGPKRVKVVYHNRVNKARVECWIPLANVH